MKTYLAKWPNGTMTVLQAESDLAAAVELDSEGDPYHAAIYVLGRGFYLTTEIHKGRIVVDNPNWGQKWRRVRLPSPMLAYLGEEVA